MHNSNNNQKIIFSNSYSPRTGHNFASEALKVFTNHEVLIYNKSETKLSNFLEVYYKLHATIYHKRNRDFFDKIILSNIRNEILKASESSYVMIKNTSFEGVKYIPQLFPNDIHILLLRDPQDVFVSFFKSIDLDKKGYKYVIKKIGKFLGIYPYYFCKKISKRIIKIIPNFSKFYIIKYEDLAQQKETVLLELKEKFNCNKSLDQIKEELNSIKVINSSFYEETGGKNIWDSKEKTKEFNPINRKKHSFFIRMGIRLGTKKLRKSLGY